MAVAFVQSHTGASVKTAGTIVYLTLNAATTIGNTLVLCVLVDNAATVGKPIVSTIDKPLTETNSWVFLGRAQHPSSTTSGAFAQGEMWAIRTSVSWPANIYNVTLDTSVTMKATYCAEFSGLIPVLRSTVGTAYSTTTTAASATTTGTTPSVGDLAFGFIFGSNAAAAQAGDTDTTGGSWSAAAGFGSTGGSAATNNFGIAQYKILTGANHQTLNNSAAMTAGNGAIVAILQQYAPPAITQAAYRFYADGTESGLLVDSAPGPSGSGSSLIVTNPKMGQSFLGNGDRPIRASFYLSKTGAPDGTILAELYDHTGTFGSSGLPTGSPLATSTTTIAASSLTTSSARYDFDFVGAPVMTNGTPYFVVLSSNTTSTGAGGVAISVWLSTGSSPGNRALIVSGTWSVQAVDYAFSVYTESALAAQDAAPTISVDAGNVNLQLRTRLQSTSAVATDPWDDFTLQCERNGDGTWKNVHPMFFDISFNPSATGLVSVGQADTYKSVAGSFLGDGMPLERAQFYVWKGSGTPSGEVRAALYAHTGTYGVSGLPTGAALATSASSFSLVGLTTTKRWIDLLFTDGPVMALGTPYFISLEVTGNTQISSFAVNVDSDVLHPGNRALFNGTTWATGVTADLAFKVGSAPVAGDYAAYYNSASLTDEAPTTNRLTAGSGSFTAGEVATGAVVRDFVLPANNYTELLYSITLRKVEFTNGDILRFRVVRAGSTAGFTYTQTPTINVTKSAVPTAQLKRNIILSNPVVQRSFTR